MRSIKANSIAQGMIVTMLTWFKPNDRRPEEVLVEAISGDKKTLKMDLITESGDKFSVAHNGEWMAFQPAEGQALRVTFQIEDEKNGLFGRSEGETFILADKNGEEAVWNVTPRGNWQLPDDECNGATHTPSELAMASYKVVRAA